MIWYEILGIVVVILGFVVYLVKNAKWKKAIENTKVVLDEARNALVDGKISKAEWKDIINKAIDAFL